jgi:hypothetical protein
VSLHQNPTVDTTGSQGVRDGSAGVTRLLEPAIREALREAVSRLDDAEAAGRPAERAMALSAVAACYRAMGAWGAAEDALRQALGQARLARNTDLLIDVLCDQADTACGLADSLHACEPAGARAARDRARDEAFEAASLAHRAADRTREAGILLRISDVLNRCGDHDDAAWLQGRAVTLMAR